MREFTVYAPAKLNLYLDVLEKRPDGYHNINTLFEKIDLKDEIHVKEKARGLRVRVEPSGACASGKDNIAYKAVQALFKKADVNLGMEIVIRKNIPVSAGLAGGSSDAASLLRAINDVFDLGVSFQDLISVAAETGKDVPFFMLDKTFAIARGAGEELEPLDAETSFSHVIIKPDIAVSTAQMYKALDNHNATSRNNAIEKIISAVHKGDVTLLKENHYNIFEEVLGAYAMDVERAKTLLENVGAGPGFLSGSGPSVFCTVKDRAEATRIFERLSKGEGHEIFVATSYKGGIYGDN